VTARVRIWAAAPWGAAAVLGALVAHFAERVHTVQPDEVIAVAASRHVIAHPFSAIDPTVNLSGRGLERGLAVVFAAVQEISGDTARAYWVQHVVCALLFAAIVPIAAGWARDLGLERWQALAAGIVTLCVPWMVLGTSFLNSGPVYALTTLALWAMWRSTVAPGAGRDIIALLALGLLAVFRIGNVVVAAAWPLAIVMFALHGRPPGVGLGAALARLPRGVLRDHPLLVAVAAIGVLAVVVKGTHWLVGGYPVRAPARAVFRDFLRVLLAYLAVGTAVVPAALALAYAVRSLLRPTGAGAAAFAALGVGAFVAFAYVAATQGAEERYIAPLAPVVLLMGMVALARRSVGPIAVLLAGVVVARAIAVTGLGADIGAYGYFAQSAQTFFRRIVLGKASLAIPFTDHHVLTTVVLAATAAGVAAVVLARRRPALAYGATAAVVAGYGLVAGVYSMHQFSKQAGYPNLTFAQQSWIDRAVGADADVALAPQGLAGVQGELVNFNRSLGSPYAPRRAALTVDPATGALRAAPRYLVVQDGVLTTIGIGGEQVAASDYLPVQARLLRVAPRALWQITSPRTVLVFATGQDECLTATLAQPSGTTARQRFAFGPARGVLSGAPLTFAAALAPGREALDLTVRGGGAATIVALSRGPCG
jgi:hypothetical protein